MIVARLATTKNPTMKTEDLDEGDNVHEGHDHHWSASGSEDCLVMSSLFPLYSVFVLRVFFGLYGVAASSLVGLYDLVLFSVMSPFCRTSD